jgi:hypothetical protein
VKLGIMTGEEIDDHQRRLRALLPTHNLPPLWGIHRVAAVV